MIIKLSDVKRTKTIRKVHLHYCSKVSCLVDFVGLELGTTDTIENGIILAGLGGRECGGPEEQSELVAASGHGSCKCFFVGHF